MALVVPFLAAPAQGQEPTGVWDAPIDLSGSLGKGTGGTAYLTLEIAHAAVLPPADIVNGLTDTRVLFVCVPQYPDCTTQGSGYSCSAPSTSTQQFGRAYYWKPPRNYRASAYLIPPPANYPSGSDFGTQDFFAVA